MSKNKSKLYNNLQSGLVIFCIFACAFLLITPFVNYSYNEKQPIHFNNGWDIYEDDKLINKSTTLPYTVADENSAFIDMYNTVPKTDFLIDAISFVAYQKNVWVYVDNQLIFEKIFTPTMLNPTTPGSGSVTAPLPYESLGKQIHIRLERVVKKDIGPISKLNIINGGITAGSLQLSDGVMIVLMFSLAMIGCVILITVVICRKLNLDILPLMSLALILLSMSSWSLCNSKLIEIVTDNWPFMHNLEYISFYLIPISVWLFFKFNWNNLTLISEIAIHVMTIFFALSLLLKLIFKVDFYNILSVFHLLVLANIPLFLIEVTRGYKNKGVSFKIICAGIIFISFSIIIDLVRYYTVDTTQLKTTAFIVGIIVLSSCLILSFMVATKEKMESDFNVVTKNNLEAEHKRYEILIQNTKDIFMDWNLVDDTIYYSQQYEAYFGRKPLTKNFMKSLDGFLHLIEFDKDIIKICTDILNGSPSQQLIGKFLSKDKWFSVTLTTIYDAENTPIRAVGIIKDITDTKVMQLEVASKNEYLQINQELYDNVLEADLSTNKIIGTNTIKLAAEIGVSDELTYDDLVNAIAEKIIYKDFKAEYIKMFSRQAILRIYNIGGQTFMLECKAKNMDGTYTWKRYNVKIFKSEISETIRMITYIKDINIEKNKESELLLTSQTDALSGLLNKGATRNIIQGFLNLSNTEKDNHSFMMVDVDNFKTINDTYGHAFGDDVITEIGRKLKLHFRDSDVLGRVGGDEFAILVKNTTDNEFLHHKCSELCNNLDLLCDKLADDYKISLSIGVSLYPQDGVNYDDLYRKADYALYESKHLGKNMYSFYKNKSE